MLPNKVFGKYDWNVNGKTGIGAAWVVAAFVLPMLVWTIFMLARMSGWVEMTRANPLWAVVWLLFSLPCLMFRLERLAVDCQHPDLPRHLRRFKCPRRALDYLYAQRFAQIGRLKCELSNSKT